MQIRASFFPLVVAGTLAAAAAGGWRMADGAAPPVSTSPAVKLASLLPMPVCGGGKRVNCVVDGDTIWVGGEKIRIVGFNSPEVHGACGRERQLAARATQRLSRLLSSEGFSIERQGHDRYGRRLAVIRIASGDITNIMVGEGLAHVWRGSKESWCG